MTSLTTTDASYAEAIRVLAARTGLSFRPHNQGLLEKGIQHAMGRAGAKDLRAYVASLKSDCRALDDLIVELTVGETYFFREPAQFEFIRRQALPEIMRRSGETHLIRTWSAGCASGEEAFSLAMLFDQEGLLHRAHILATDISRASLKKAQEALFPQWSLRGPGAKMAKPYLRPSGELYQLDEKIRRSVHFEYLNLALDVYPAVVTGTWALNLILCRNVLIYFDAETIARVARRLYESLAEGGWLITSSADPALDKFAPFEVVFTDGGVFYRRGPSGVVTAQPLRPSTFATWTVDPEAIDEQVQEVIVDEAIDDEEVASAQPCCPTTNERRAPADPHDEARRALLEGDLRRAIQLTEAQPLDPIACAIHIQALANLDTAAAEHACAAAAARHPLSAELSYLHAILLMEKDRCLEAVQAIRRLLCLDRTLGIAHFTLGSLLRRLGDAAGAARAFRNCRDLCAARREDEHVPLSDAETCGGLTRAAEDQLRQLGDCQEEHRRR